MKKDELIEKCWEVLYIKYPDEYPEKFNFIEIDEIDIYLDAIKEEYFYNNDESYKEYFDYNVKNYIKKAKYFLFDCSYNTFTFFSKTSKSKYIERELISDVYYLLKNDSKLKDKYIDVYNKIK